MLQFHPCTFTPSGLLHRPWPSSRRALRLPSLFGESTAAGPGRSVALSPAESCRSDVVARRLRFGYALRSLGFGYALPLFRPLRGRCALRADRRYAFILVRFPLYNPTPATAGFFSLSPHALIFRTIKLRSFTSSQN